MKEKVEQIKQEIAVLTRLLEERKSILTQLEEAEKEARIPPPPDPDGREKVDLPGSSKDATAAGGELSVTERRLKQIKETLRNLDRHRDSAFIW